MFKEVANYVKNISWVEYFNNGGDIKSADDVELIVKALAYNFIYLSVVNKSEEEISKTPTLEKIFNNRKVSRNIKRKVKELTSVYKFNI